MQKHDPMYDALFRPIDTEEIISRGEFRITFKRKEDGEVIIKVQANKGIAVFSKSGNTIIIKNMETESA